MSQVREEVGVYLIENSPEIGPVFILTKTQSNLLHQLPDLFFLIPFVIGQNNGQVVFQRVKNLIFLNNLERIRTEFFAFQIQLPLQIGFLEFLIA